MDKYDKHEAIGEGVHGAVYKGTCKETGRTVAIKKFKLGSSPGHDGLNSVAIREIKLLKELKSPHVVQLLDVVPRNKSLRLIFEYMPFDLERVIKDRHAPMSAADVKSYMRMILLGLSHIHERGVVHRDLKPNNLLIAPCGHVKLGDFGMAKLLHDADAGGRLTTQVSVPASALSAVCAWVCANHYRQLQLLFMCSSFLTAMIMLRGAATCLWSTDWCLC